MSRWAYGLVIVLLAAGLVYLFWPSSVLTDVVPLWVGERPEQFTIDDPSHPQQVDGLVVHLLGGQRPADAMAVGRLFFVLRQVKVPATRIHANVPAADLGAYGIDGRHGLDAGQVHLRWGLVDGTGYVWDGSRILVIGAQEEASIVASAARLDQQGLLAGIEPTHDLHVDTLSLALSDGRWQDLARPGRPGLSRHVGELLRLIAQIQLRDLASRPLAGAQVRHRLEYADRHGTTHHLEVRALPTGRTEIACDDLPPQRLSADLGDAITAAITALSRDYLLELDPSAAIVQLKDLAVRRGPLPWFHCERRTLAYRPGETSWELSWAEGAENASQAALERILQALGACWVVQAEPGRDPVPPGPLALTFELTLDSGEVVTLGVDGNRAWSRTAHGLLPAPSSLAVLQPAALLDTVLLDADPDRICKLQRVAHTDPPLEEVLTRDEQGQWRRTHGAGAVDAVAIGRLARALTETHAHEARLLVLADRAGMEHPALEVDVRLAPRAAGAPRMEITDERDTVTQDRGFACYRDSQQRWWMVDVEGGVAYQVDAELIDLLHAPLTADDVLPVVPSLVTRLELVDHQVQATLTRDGDQWWWSEQGTGARPGRALADPAQVRRYLRQLATTHAAQRLPTAADVLPAQADLTISAVMPAGTVAEERLVMSMVRTPAGVEASVSSSIPHARLPPGRLRLEATMADELLGISRERFLAAAAPARAP